MLNKVIVQSTCHMDTHTHYAFMLCLCLVILFEFGACLSGQVNLGTVFVFLLVVVALLLAAAVLLHPLLYLT